MERENKVVIKQVVIPESCNRGSSTHPPFCNETTNDKRGRFPSPSRTGKLGNDALFLRQVSPDLQTATTDPRQKHSGEGQRLGFTLIELLVVVLIIGILAAVAVPQYQKAVWKSRNVQLKTLVSSLAQAENAYYMANGQYADTFDELSLDVPLAAATEAYNLCALSVVGGRNSVRQGKDFEVVLNNPNGLSTGGVGGVWTDGPYKCMGFTIPLSSQNMICYEANHNSGGTYVSDGRFCEKLEKGTNRRLRAGWYLYDLP